MHENRETSSMFPTGGRSGKAERHTPDVYVGEEGVSTCHVLRQCVRDAPPASRSSRSRVSGYSRTRSTSAAA